MAKVQQRAQPAAVPENLLASSNADFSLDLYQQLGRVEPTKNLFFSPASISVAMAMTYLGARKNTADEMKRTLKFPVEDEKLHEGFAELLAAYNKGENITLHMANRLFAEQQYKFAEKYLADSQKYYDAELAAVDFVRNFEAARKTINQWVEDKTATRIKDILPAGAVNALTRLVLVNAVYFKGDWMSKFKEEDTEDGEFTALDDSKVTVPMMNQKKNFMYGVSDALQARAIELPYAGETMSLVIMLPEPGKFEHFEKNLKVNDLLSCEKSFRMSGHSDVKLTLPRFPVVDGHSGSILPSEV